MTQRLLTCLLRAVRSQQQRDLQQLCGLQLSGAACIHAADTQSQILQRHLWAQQAPCQLQSQHGTQPQSLCCSGDRPWQLRQQHQQQQQAWPMALQWQSQRAYSAADPARAIAENMAEVAQRKLADVQKQHEALQAKLEGLSPGSDAYQKLIKESAALAPLVEGYEELQRKQQDIDGLREVMLSEGDKELQDLAREELQQVEKQFEELQQSLLLAMLPDDAEDEGNVILELRSSMGGEWAGDFAADLLEMYRLFAAEHGWRFEVLDSKPTDLGGIKSATAMISGHGAFGELRWESGVHRATMVPGNDKHGRMQTGTAVVIALPEAPDNVAVTINETDLRIETYRASGKGGQHVNTTDSAVRIVHIPSGIVVTCQNERSQGQNKMQAMKVLRAKLHEAEHQKQAATLSAQRTAAGGSGNANERIRSYNYQDGRVSDHRVGVTLQIDVERFMSDGQRLAEVIQAVKLQHQQEQLQELLES